MSPVKTEVTFYAKPPGLRFRLANVYVEVQRGELALLTGRCAAGDVNVRQDVQRALAVQGREESGRRILDTQRLKRMSVIRVRAYVFRAAVFKRPLRRGTAIPGVATIRGNRLVRVQEVNPDLQESVRVEQYRCRLVRVRPYELDGR